MVFKSQPPHKTINVSIISGMFAESQLTAVDFDDCGPGEDAEAPGDRAWLHVRQRPAEWETEGVKECGSE